MVTTLMITSTVQHVKHTRPLSLPLNMTKEKTLAKEATRQTTDATKVRSATSFNREAFQSVTLLTPFELNFKSGRMKKIVM